MAISLKVWLSTPKESIVNSQREASIYWSFGHSLSFSSLRALTHKHSLSHTREIEDCLQTLSSYLPPGSERPDSLKRHLHDAMRGNAIYWCAPLTLCRMRQYAQSSTPVCGAMYFSFSSFAGWTLAIIAIYSLHLSMRGHSGGGGHWILSLE